MKKIILMILVLLLQLNISLAYTVTMRVKGVDLVVTSEQGNEILLEGKDSGIKRWEVKKGDVNIVDNRFIMPATNVELEAVVEYQVTFNSNGGSGSMEKQTFLYNVHQNLLPNSFTRDGYNFKGWAIEPTGSVIYENGVSYTAFQDITLYAIWEIATPYTVVTIFPVGVNVEGVYENHMCDDCGGVDHECQVVNIMVEEGYSTVVEDMTKTTTSPYTIITTAPNGVLVEGVYENHMCDDCGGRDHECQVVNIMVEEGYSNVELYGESLDTPITIVTLQPEGVEVEGVYENHKCDICGGQDHECEVINITVESGNTNVYETTIY